MEKRKRIEELVQLLNEAGKAYYQEGREIISNLEYDKAYDELISLEKETGIVLSGSPSQNVGYSVATALPKEAHESPMLSLDKTKSVEALREFLGEQEGILSWKLDGLTVVMTYEGGELVKAITRGNGRIGEIVTENAKRFRNLPLQIPFKGRLVLRGEALIRYSDFNAINEEIPEEGAKYKNPRNLCSGSVRQLDPKITWERRVQFCPFSLVSAEMTGDLGGNAEGNSIGKGSISTVNLQEYSNNIDFQNSHIEEFKFLSKQGFSVVDYVPVKKENLAEAVQDFAKKVKENDFPSDGLVLLMDDISYGKSLGTTAKFPRNAIAFKWEDEEEKTILREVEWSPSRTGLINPVAIFDPVELEGTMVSRASLHNISYLEDLKLGIGDEITVYKANMIIPQIAENLTKSGQLPIPEYCPACHEKTKIVQDKEAKMLYCENPHCPAKRIKQFALFVSRDALNIEGLSEMTLEKFIGKGFIQEFPDLFSLEEHKDEIISMEGFGLKSYEKLIENAEKARKTSLARLLYGLGIGGIGASNARVLSEAFHEDAEELLKAELSEVLSIKGIGPILGESIVRYFKEEENIRLFRKLLSLLQLQKEEKEENAALSGKVFVITGSLEHFQNRKELEEEIRKAGASTAGSVSKNTAYLINNDKNSSSSKNKKAQELGIPILSEEDFLRLLKGE